MLSQEFLSELLPFQPSLTVSHMLCRPRCYFFFSSLLYCHQVILFSNVFLTHWTSEYFECTLLSHSNFQKHDESSEPNTESTKHSRSTPPCSVLFLHLMGSFIISHSAIVKSGINITFLKNLLIFHTVDGNKVFFFLPLWNLSHTCAQDSWIFYLTLLLKAPWEHYFVFHGTCHKFEQFNGSNRNFL